MSKAHFKINQVFHVKLVSKRLTKLTMFDVRSTCMHVTSIAWAELDLRENAVTMIVLQIWSVSEVEMSDYNKALRWLKRNAALSEKGIEKN